MPTQGIGTKEDVQTLQVGAAEVTLINVGDVSASLADWLRVPEQEWLPHHAALFVERVRLPIRCVHIALPGLSILVDASAYEIGPDSAYRIPGYQPPPGLLPLLAGRGVDAETVNHVVITHGHRDHFNGSTIRDGAVYRPAFSAARYHLGRPDWEGNSTQEALRDRDSVEGRTLGVLHGDGLLDLVDGHRDLCAEVRIIPAPGETAGHQIVRVHSQGETLYCLGDLYHHPVETEQPAWMAHWANARANGTSRQSLAAAASMENALLVAAHFPEIGRLAGKGSGYRWIARG